MSQPLRSRAILLALAAASFLIVVATRADSADQVKTSAGSVQGSTSSDGRIHVFKGIPYAAPPVGDLRWKAPQPVKPWKDVRKATEFGARCMQTRVYGDMGFRSARRIRWLCERPSRRSEEHTSELQSHVNLVCRLLLEKKNTTS